MINAQLTGALFLLAAATVAVTSTSSPAKLLQIDNANWQLDTCFGEGNAAKSVKPPSLDSYTDQNFRLISDASGKQAAQLRVPFRGCSATTPSSEHFRTELKELTQMTVGPHTTTIDTLSVSMAIRQVIDIATRFPNSDANSIVVAQIHGGGKPWLFIFAYDDGAGVIKFQTREEIFSPNGASSHNINHQFSTQVAYGVKFQFQIVSSKDGVTVSIDNENFSFPPANDGVDSGNTYYFKTGNYCQGVIGSSTGTCVVDMYTVESSHIKNK